MNRQVVVCKYTKKKKGLGVTTQFILYCVTVQIPYSGIFFAILGRGPKAFLIGKSSDINPGFGIIFSEYSKLIIFSKLT